MLGVIKEMLSKPWMFGSIFERFKIDSRN